MHRADLRDRAAATEEPTVSAGSGRRWVSRDDERGRVRRLDVDAGAEHLPAQDQRSDADDRPVHRRVDVGAGRLRPRRAPPCSAPSHRRASSTSGLRRRCRRASARHARGALRWPAGRPGRARGAVADRVVPDRRHAALVDRKLQPEGAVQRHDLRPRLAGRQEPVGGRGPWSGVSADEPEPKAVRANVTTTAMETAIRPAIRRPSSRGGSSLGRAARLPGGSGRGHAAAP